MKDILQPLFKQFMPFAQKRMGFKKPPRVFLRDDPQNAQNPLGKTAYYDPEQMSVTLYVNGRHPKDVMRSLSHELVHHTQNCNGQFNNVGEMGEGYAQNDEHLREMERQAYEQGNLCFRDWEDSIKGTIYNESLQKGAKKDMSTKNWKNRELPTLLTEKWGFSFNLLTESQDEEAIEEGHYDDYDDFDYDLEKREMEAEKELYSEPADARTPAQKRLDGEMEIDRDIKAARMDRRFPRKIREEEEKEEELDEGAASSGRELSGDREQNDDRRSSQKRARPMEEAEKPDFPDVDGDGDREEPISKASKEKKGDKEEKSDKDTSKVPPQLRKHVKNKMDEAQIRQLIRKLVMEAIKKENK
jgi:hypothetical protein